MLNMITLTVTRISLTMKLVKLNALRLSKLEALDRLVEFTRSPKLK